MIARLAPAADCGMNEIKCCSGGRGCQADEVEALVAAHLGQEEPVGFHAQAGLEQRLRGDLGHALRVFAVVQVHDVRMVRSVSSGRVLDRDQSLPMRHLLDQALHERRSCPIRSCRSRRWSGALAPRGAGIRVAAGVAQRCELLFEGKRIARTRCGQRLRCVRRDPRVRSHRADESAGPVCES